ncbi:hypothetical protein EYF80_031046 [Liparis tanakae]|uniref:Uncharacterized protein n=1 Tax=Liparis tanakae TaxID=230148 RepID=A0A4Z2GZH9_9TELE|nr:hypothetical protein EYF80_031046 [Liparis tanakae]
MRRNTSSLAVRLDLGDRPAPSVAVELLVNPRQWSSASARINEAFSARPRSIARDVGKGGRFQRGCEHGTYKTPGTPATVEEYSREVAGQEMSEVNTANICTAEWEKRSTSPLPGGINAGNRKWSDTEIE